MRTRLYAVTAMIGSESRQYLVDASNKNVARAHVGKKHVTADIADGKTVSQLMSKGIKPESAVEDAETLPIAGTDAPGS